ncbi:uncharacterized protein LOC123448174 [Hordeum vulgare subsp. vulgare]|uniref:uncharacterized protein LOC123448174 n=1 Tax=Hordeum vulgare subsp. vulgare TaxID=112509 RepID=UPI00162BC3A7|nr:uncharacterized protein LOC123448174 [Hordeum vulgare subsp. vulgare]
MKTKTEASSSGKPKRPATAYILFIDEFKKEHPEMKKVTEISKAASREWARLGITGQASYFAEYRRLMEVYNQSKNVSVNTCDKPKRPPTAFFLFQQKFKQSHPALTKVVEISKAAGEEWRALGDAGRAPFFAEYDKLMDAFMQKKYPTNNPRAAPRRCPCACRCCRRCHVPAVPLSSPPPPQATSNSRAVASTVDGYSRAVASTFDGLNCEHVNDYSESEWTGLKHEGTVSGLEPSSLRSVKKKPVPRRGGLEQEGEVGPSPAMSVKKKPVPRRGGLRQEGEVGPSSAMSVKKKPVPRRGGLRQEGEVGPSSAMSVKKKPVPRRGGLRQEGEVGPSSAMSVKKKPVPRRGGLKREREVGGLEPSSSPMSVKKQRRGV